MHPILVEQMARQKMDSFDREAEADRLASLANMHAVRSAGLRERVARTAGRVRLIVNGAAA